MQHKQLEYFLALADTLHFGRAAEQCYVSAPTLSRNIQQLEQAVGMALFVRDNRHVSLTLAGEHFVSYAQTTLRQWSDFKASVNAQQELTGELSIYCSVSAAYSFLNPLLSAFRRQYARVDIKLHTGDPAHAVARVLDHHEDVAIAARPDKLPQQITFRRLGWSPLVFIAPQEPCEVSDKVNHLGEKALATVPFIVPEQGLNKSRLLNWWQAKRIKPPIYAQVSGHEALVSMVGLGLGVALLPQVVLETSPLADKVRIINVEDSPPPFEIGLVTLKRRINEPVLNACWDIAKEI